VIRGGALLCASTPHVTRDARPPCKMQCARWSDGPLPLTRGPPSPPVCCRPITTRATFACHKASRARAGFCPRYGPQGFENPMTIGPRSRPWPRPLDARVRVGRGVCPPGCRRPPTVRRSILLATMTHPRPGLGQTAPLPARRPKDQGQRHKAHVATDMRLFVRRGSLPVFLPDKLYRSRSCPPESSI